MSRSFQLGYCTNVHAGPDLQSTKHNLEKYALDVKRRFSPDAPMGVGLWLAAPAASQLLEGSALSDFSNWLAANGLIPFTFNGFPYSDFHQDVVKLDVYLPTWWDERRLQYTKNLAAIQHVLLPDGLEGSISTMPISWGKPGPTDEQWNKSAEHMQELVEYLHRLESETGRLIYVCIEPEPGCALDTGDDICRFFDTHLLPAGDEEKTRRHIRVCHDVCHSGVMFEPQHEVVELYRKAGIRIGKVQVSSAVWVPFKEIAAEDRVSALKQLSDFNEIKYMHQTSIRDSDGKTKLYDDLGDALATVENPESLESTWSVHFHVPIFLESFGHLQSTQSQVLECLECCLSDEHLTHFEVETYAWNVLPNELQTDDLAEGIAREMTWFQGQLAALQQS